MKYKKVEVVEARGIFLNVRIKMWGARSKVQEGKLDLPADIIRATQDLLTAEDVEETLELLRKEKSEVLSFVRRNSLSFGIIGFDMVQRERVSDINEFLTEKQKKFYSLVDAIDIEKCKENFKKKHPKFYRPEKYPSERYFKSHFEFTWSFKDLKPSEALKEIDPNVYKEEEERWKADIRVMQEDTVRLIASEINLRINNLKDMCSDKKRVSQRTINGLNSLLEKWDDLWSGFISSDSLKKAIKEIRTNIKDLEADDLRTDEDLKKKIKSSAKAILDTVKVEIETVGKRKLVY